MIRWVETSLFKKNITTIESTKIVGTSKLATLEFRSNQSSDGAQLSFAGKIKRPQATSA
jgi:hypothetical protein